MKFTVSQSALLDAVAVVMKGIAPSSTLPILSGVLVRAADGVLEFQTSNYTISTRVPDLKLHHLHPPSHRGSRG